MKKETVLAISGVLLAVLGAIIAAIGLFAGAILLPPVITGLGFFVLSWVCFTLRKA